MKETLVYKSKRIKVTMDLSEDGDRVAIFVDSPEVINAAVGYTKVAEFFVEHIWDMLRDRLAVLDVGPYNGGLFRRKKEALAAIERGMRLF